MARVFIELAVGEGEHQLSPAEAQHVAAAAQRVGVTGVRLRDGAGDPAVLDPSILGAHLAARYAALGFLIDAPTTHNAPYNLARRVLSFDRATAGQVGLILRRGDGDEVSATATPDPPASDPAQRWTEYAAVLTALWESFPRTALIGDRHGAVAIDDRQIHPIEHTGSFYRVNGPLDGPASVQGRPLLVAADVAVLGWDRVAAVADAAIVDGADLDDAEAALQRALITAGRPRAEFALLARLVGDTDLRARLHRAHAADGVLIAVDGSARAAEVLDELTSPPADNTGPTLRDRLGLPSVGAA